MFGNGSSESLAVTKMFLNFGVQIGVGAFFLSCCRCYPNVLNFGIMLFSLRVRDRALVVQDVSQAADAERTAPEVSSDSTVSDLASGNVTVPAVACG